MQLSLILKEDEMSELSHSERTMWQASEAELPPKATDEEINAKYDSREWRIITETNREQLPNFVEALKRPGWMELRPFYQRRLRWDIIRQSKLIESFIMNIPIPPLFVYESDLAKYEVMDGQQRLTAIKEFYSNSFKLTGLEQWPELNGRTYSKLPTSIKRGIDRRSISYIVLLKESAETSEDQLNIRKLVFERLNTGGIKLEHQEIRNSLFQGKFNDLLLKLANNTAFRQAWGLPVYNESEKENPSPELLESTFYSKMQDIEVILRFFALRHVQHFKRGVQGFLDLYMAKSRFFADADLKFLEDLFEITMTTARAIYGELLFRPWNKDKGWANKPQVAFTDAVFVGVSKNLHIASILVARKEAVIEATKRLIESNEDGTFTGRGNSKNDIKNRIDLFSNMLSEVAVAA